MGDLISFADETKSKPELLSADAFGKYVGVSGAEVLRRVRNRTLFPAVMRGSRAFFTKDQATEFREAARPRKQLLTFSGEEAAAAFSALREGASAVDLVMRLKLHPGVVAELLQAFANMSAVVIFSAEDTAKLRAEAGIDPREWSNGSEFASLVAAAVRRADEAEDRASVAERISNEAAESVAKLRAATIETSRLVEKLEEKCEDAENLAETRAGIVEAKNEQLVRARETIIVLEKENVALRAAAARVAPKGVQ